MNSPNPALVTDRAAQRMPRWALLLFCAAYVLPGLFGRDPWKSADITAFGYMLEIASGHTAWLQPQLGGLPTDGALLPYWLGAVSIKLLGPLVPAALAARLPFALLLALALTLTWYATYHLARTEAAQPLPFAFGGEANPVDYARAIADGALLAQIATLGLLQLGHETTPEMLQLLGASLFLYALAASPFRGVKSRLGVLLALAIMAASGAPAMAIGMGALGTFICLRSHYPEARRFGSWVLVGVLLAAGVASALGAWAWRVKVGSSQVLPVLRMLAWFTWPAWPLTLWTLWHWRRHSLRRHIVLPLSCAIVGLASSLLMGGSDRALMLGLPSMAVLAAFALPTLQRATAAAIDWFSVCFFTIGALVIWVVYVAMQTGFPAQPAANVAKLAPGLDHSFHGASLLVATLGTVAWGWLVHWRAGRNRHPLWKSLVLPAGGVALCWLLLMSLWLPLLDYARSLRPLVQRVSQHVPAESCIALPGGSRALVAGLVHFGRYRVEADAGSADTSCDFLIQTQSERPGNDASTTPHGWMFVATEKRPTNRDDNFVIYRREPPDSVPRIRHP